MKIGIVGSGFVGATAGYALVMQGVGVSSVTLSLPRLVGGTVLQTFPLPLSTEENVRLSESAMIIRRALDELEI